MNKPMIVIINSEMFSKLEFNILKDKSSFFAWLHPDDMDEFDKFVDELQDRRAQIEWKKTQQSGGKDEK